MKPTLLYVACMFLVVTLLPGCEVIGGIFKAGMWVGILAVAAVIAVILFIVGRMGKK